MKSIVIATDFSAHAENAAVYSVHIAQQLKANLLLCNAYTIPAQAIEAAQVAWPLEDSFTMKEASKTGLKNLSTKLKQTLEAHSADTYVPDINLTSEPGSVADVVGAIADETRASMIVMGTAHNGGLVRFLWGSSRNRMIEDMNAPILLVPDGFTYNGIKRIAFATDLQKSDIHVLHCLTSFARHFNAAILIVHVAPDNDNAWLNDTDADEFLNDVTAKANYANIYYRQITNNDVNDGLDWLARHGRVDMMVMVHRRHSLVERLVTGSHTKEMARNIDIPLLVFPNENVSCVF